MGAKVLYLRVGAMVVKLTEGEALSLSLALLSSVVEYDTEASYKLADRGAVIAVSQSQGFVRAQEPRLQERID
jgi:hypothetical protein